MMVDLDTEVRIVFSDGTVVFGGGDELFFSPNEDEMAIKLDDDRLDLIKRIQGAIEEHALR